MAIDLQYAREVFQARVGAEPETIVRAPGRVNLIGEHTDYNEGFVLPMAITRETLLLARRRGDRRLHCHAANFDRTADIDLEHLTRNPEDPWTDYLAGVAFELAKLGQPLSGADVVIIGDVPLASGLSSSASLEMAALVLFETLGGFNIEGAEAPKLGRRVENEFLGLKSGIMDQFVVRMAAQNHALFLDCRSHIHENVPVAFGHATFVIANTKVARGLTASKYNERVEQCGEAVRILAEKTRRQEATHLRDFALEELDSHRDAMPELVYRRARHVITENARAVEACEAMKSGDAQRMGVLMNASHESLRHDYEVSCDELDAMVEGARRLPGCIGARMTGAGFGGCTVNLVSRDAVAEFCAGLLENYKEATGLDGDTIVSAPAQGASMLAVDSYKC